MATEQQLEEYRRIRSYLRTTEVYAEDDDTKLVLMNIWDAMRSLEGYRNYYDVHNPTDFFREDL